MLMFINMISKADLMPKVHLCCCFLMPFTNVNFFMLLAEADCRCRFAMLSFIADFRSGFLTTSSGVCQVLTSFKFMLIAAENLRCIANL